MPVLFIPAILVAAPLAVTSGNIRFNSETPLEKFSGGGGDVSGFLDLEQKKVTIKVGLGDWKTNGKLRTAHMHENYLETDKFPVAEFTGTIGKYDEKTGKIDATGTMKLHGVEMKNFTIGGVLRHLSGHYELKAEFNVLLSDFGIKVPSLLVLKVNNEINVQSDLVIKEK